jgi:hypothetical protein
VHPGFKYSSSATDHNAKLPIVESLPAPSKSGRHCHAPTLGRSCLRSKRPQPLAAPTRLHESPHYLDPRFVPIDHPREDEAREQSKAKQSKPSPRFGSFSAAPRQKTPAAAETTTATGRRGTTATRHIPVVSSARRSPAGGKRWRASSGDVCACVV